MMRIDGTREEHGKRNSSLAPINPQWGESTSLPLSCSVCGDKLHSSIIYLLDGPCSGKMYRAMESLARAMETLSRAVERLTRAMESHTWCSGKLVFTKVGLHTYLADRLFAMIGWGYAILTIAFLVRVFYDFANLFWIIGNV
jgi:hypothetical protein